MKLATVAIFILLTLVSAATARPDESRLQLLSRGLNLSHWFAQSTSGYHSAHLHTFVSDEDVKRIKAVGFRHVRLGVEPSIVDQEPVRALLATKIQKLLAAGLAVVVDLHPVGDSKAEFRTQAGRSKLIETWMLLSGTLANFDPGQLFIEVMNEPFPLEGAEWQTLQNDLVKVIRDKAPLHTILVNSGGWSGIDDLVDMKPLDDPNIVYTAHWYGPLLFTHQGADWTWEMVRRVKAVDWPIARAGADQKAKEIANDKDVEVVLRNEIAGGQFEASLLGRKLDRLADWQTRNNMPAVYIGEFGVYRLQSPRTALLRWVASARGDFEARGFGWSYWDYSPSFGLVARAPSGTTFNADMLTALGLPAK